METDLKLGLMACGYEATEAALLVAAAAADQGLKSEELPNLSPTQVAERTAALVEPGFLTAMRNNNGLQYVAARGGCLSRPASVRADYLALRQMDLLCGVLGAIPPGIRLSTAIISKALDRDRRHLRSLLFTYGFLLAYDPNHYIANGGSVFRELHFWRRALAKLVA